MKARLLLIGFALAAPLAAMEPLRSNGAVFYMGEQRLPLRALDASNLLSLPENEQESLLNRAAAAGFNAVGFDAPLFGPASFCAKLGTADEAFAQSFSALLSKMETRGLYAFPVLWTKGAVEAFQSAGGGEDKFMAGRAQAGWQAWLLRQFLAKSQSAARKNIGGWVLLRRDWPREDAAKVKALGGWLYGQIWVARKAGATQLCGASFLVKGDLGKGGAPDAGVSGFSMNEPPPLAELKEVETRPLDPKAMDKLPPVPGSEQEGSQSAEALTPWDLEGVDWDQMGAGLKDLPAKSGLDFLELTLDTEDWYRVGEAMAAMAEKSLCAPLAWRHDWRSASRYERQKRLEAPAPLAGLMGPWPDDDWPEPEEHIWPPASRDLNREAARPLLFKFLEVVDDGGKLKLALHLNRPGEIDLQWGASYPPDKKVRSTEFALVHKLALKGARKGESILFTARATSRRWGAASLKPRWIKLQTRPKTKPAARR